MIRLCYGFYVNKIKNYNKSAINDYLLLARRKLNLTKDHNKIAFCFSLILFIFIFFKAFAQPDLLIVLRHTTNPITKISFISAYLPDGNTKSTCIVDAIAYSKLNGKN